MKPLAVTGILALAVLAGCSREPATIEGAVLRASADPRGQVPLSGVRVTVAGGLASSDAISDERGFFRVRLLGRPLPRRSVLLEFHRAGYAPLELPATTYGELYLARMTPIERPAPASNRPPVTIANLRVRYSVKAPSTIDVGSEAKTFDAPNVANVPCAGRRPCSPDGKWKATIASASLDAGRGSEFRDARVSCIAGPCPFTAIESDGFSRGGQRIAVSILNWSGQTTFVIEGEVVRPMRSDLVRMSYPVIFGDVMNFTLPAGAEGPSLEAEMDGIQMVFPLGPDLLLSWATCEARSRREQTTLYRCELKPGYAFPEAPRKMKQ